MPQQFWIQRVFVGVDPGKNNLVTMADGDRQVLSVTARERQHYVGEIAHQGWLKGFKDRPRASVTGGPVVSGQGIIMEPDSVAVAEKAYLGTTNSRSCHLRTFMKYVAARLRVEGQMQQHYAARRHRRHEFGKYFRRRSLCNRISTVFERDGRKAVKLGEDTQWAQAPTLHPRYWAEEAGAQEVLDPDDL